VTQSKASGTFFEAPVMNQSCSFGHPFVKKTSYIYLFVGLKIRNTSKKIGFLAARGSIYLFESEFQEAFKIWK
jgi:hypothetical protein